MPVPSHDSDRLRICVLVVSIMLLPTILICVLGLFKQCGIFCFSFYKYCLAWFNPSFTLRQHCKKGLKIAKGTGNQNT